MENVKIMSGPNFKRIIIGTVALFYILLHGNKIKGCSSAKVPSN